MQIELKMDMNFVIFILLNMAPPQKLFLAPSVTCGDASVMLWQNIMGTHDVIPTYQYCDGMIHCNL